MASSGNFCTWTPLLGIKDDGDSGITLSNGNTTATQTHNGIATTGTLAPSSGKFYWEIYYSASSDFSDGHLLAGWQSLKNNVEYAYTKQQPGSGQGAPSRYLWGSHLMNYKGSGTSAYQGGYLSSYNDVNNDTYDGAYNLGLRVGSAKTLQFAGDFDNHKLYFGVDNTWYSLANSGTGGSAANTASGSFDTSYAWSIESTWQGYQWVPACWFTGAASGTVATINAGQDSTFSGRLTAGGNADANGFGDFRYAPPSGFLAMCSGNLPISDNIDPAQTDDDFPSKQFNVATWTGNSTNDRAISLDIAPDLVIIKERGAANNWYWYDSNRGASVGLFSNLNQAEATDTSELKSFTSTGFTLGTGGGTNNNNDTYCGWGWRANGGTTTTDTSGDISTVRQSNTASGFAILTWSGNGSNNQRLPHGLGVKPAFVIAKRRDAAQSWGVWTQYLGDNSKELQLESNSAMQNSSNAWYQSGMTTSFVGIGSDRNHSSSTNVAYIWADVEGMQKFGFFEGNSDANGPFVYTGFRPRMVFVKAADATENWQIRDTARSTFNADSQVRIYWNSSSAEGSASTASPIDFLSNGFKVRGSNTEINGATMVYGAWADVPFKYNNTF